MAKKLAIDWDESELRVVAAQCSGSHVKVIDVVIVPLDGREIADVIESTLRQRSLDKTEALVAIGRGRAELRDLQLPPVPDEELPDMVRFQAIRSFASAGDSATIDFLVTRRSDQGVELIAAAIAPGKLESVRQACQGAHLTLKRIALRPLGAAALYLTRSNSESDGGGDVVLIDLLASDAEIVIVRNSQVVFLRTVKLPSNAELRPAALAGELRRSLVAAGASGTPAQVVLWGRESIHREDIERISQATGSRVRTLNPFELVDVDKRLELPEHTGRLAPLIGLLAADETAGEHLIDFLNPRQRIEEAPNRLKNALMIGAPIAAVLLAAFFVYQQFRSMDQRIAGLQSEIAAMEPDVKAARTSVDRTELIDQFLDGDVNWLSEMQRLAEVMPPSDQLILRSVSGTTDARQGGGRMTLVGAVTDPAVIEQFEAAVRDENHQVVGQGSSEQRSNDAYRWDFTETIKINPESIRSARYEGLAPDAEPATDAAAGLAIGEDAPATATETAAVNAKPEDAVSEDAPPEDATPEDAALAVAAPADAAPADAAPADAAPEDAAPEDAAPEDAAPADADAEDAPSQPTNPATGDGVAEGRS